jgi:chlorite dismutase
MTTAGPSAPATASSAHPAADPESGVAGTRYSGYFVYSRVSDLSGDGDGDTDPAAELAALTARLAAEDVVIRGYYDVSGMRADADMLVWWHAPAAEQLQAAGRALRRTAVGRVLAPSWSAIGVHREAEFNKAHIPAFLSGQAPRAWAAVYPFVRSYDWYLLPDNERRALLAEHGMLGRDHPAVLSNTVAAFALGDYEWLLALEADELHEIVDMMRHLRSSATRRHVREEIPFFTGRRIDEQSVVEVVS